MKVISLIILIFFSFSSSFAEIAYIDINHILNKSKVGISLNSHLKSLNDEFSVTYSKIETKIIKKEKEILAQKNIIKKNEFDKKLLVLSEEIKNYRKDKQISKKNINNIQLENTKKILKLLNPIITKYVEINSISMVIPKKNIIVGKKNLDITDQIIKLLNDNIKKINF